MKRVTRVGRNASITATVKDRFAAKSDPAARKSFARQVFQYASMDSINGRRRKTPLGK
jgi:hypothetical protein